MKLTTVTYPDGSTEKTKYDNEEHVIQQIDRQGNKTVTEYDPAGRVTAITYPDGGTVKYAYDKVGNIIKETNQKGAVTKRTYDKAGNVTVVTDNNGSQTKFEYDSMSRLICKIDALSGKTEYTYSSAGDLLSEKDALGHVVSYTYDSYGNRLTVTDPMGNTTKYTYDENNNVVSVTDALGNVTKYECDCRNFIVKITDALGHSVQYGYDALGRRVSVTDARGNTVYTEYDANGNVVKAIDAKGNTVSTTKYNKLNLAETVTDAAGKTTSYSYNKLGKPETVTDPFGNKTSFTYNWRGQNTAVKDVTTNTSIAEHDLLGNITALIGPGNGKTRYSYDGIGRLISETTTSNGTIKYEYNALNLLTTIINARQQSKILAYDDVGRITKYTCAEGVANFTYDANGNVLVARDVKGKVTRTFDKLNRVTSYSDIHGNTIKYEYDAVGNLKKLTYPDNTAVTYTYDANNNLATVTDWSGRKTTYTYDKNNKVTQVVKPDGTTTATVYDRAQRITSIKVTKSGTTICGFELEYDDLGRIISEKNLYNGVKMCYIYDVLSRVVRRTTIDSANGFETCENYGSNPAGNLTLTGDESFRYDDNNRLISYKDKTVSYDADGNMLLSPLGGSTMGFSYDSDNHLISAGTTTYTYDVENTRARIYCGESITSCTYNTNARLSQLLVRTVDGDITKYVYGLGLIGEESDGKFKTYHFDYRGSTVAITDESGTVTDTFEYETYGRLTSRTGTTDTPFLYNGRDGVMSDANGLYYMRARYYSPELKRFINADIVAGDISNAITLNRYAYANGNPVSNVDPFGLSAERGQDSLEYEESWGPWIIMSTDKSKGHPNYRPNSGEPNSRFTAPNGDWREYGPDGKPSRDYDHDDHHQPDWHPHDENGGHYHDWDYPDRSDPYVMIVGGACVIIAAIGIIVVAADDVTGIGVADDGLIATFLALLEKGLEYLVA